MFEPILATLRRHPWLAFMAFLIPFTGAAVFAMTLPNLYRATATILVQRDVEPGADAQPSDVETRLQTIREEVLSRERLDALVERFELYPELRQRAPKEVVIDRLRKDIQIQLKGSEQGAAPAGTIAFSLSFRGPYRFLAASVANALAASYVQENLNIRGRQAKSAAAALEGQLSEVRVRLDEQESRIAQFQAAHNGELPQQFLVNLARIQQLEMQLQLTRDSRLRASDFRDLRGRPVTDPRSVDIPGVADGSTAQLARLRQELAELKTSYSDSYPDVARIKKEISTLEGRLASAPPDAAVRPPKAPPFPVDDDVRTLDSEEARLRREIDTYRARVDRAPQREQEFAQMSRDYSTTKELYGSLLKKYQEARLADDMERDNKGGQLRILDAAITPPGPYAPNRQRLILVAFMAALAFSAGTVALANRVDTSFHTVDDLRSFTRVPVLVSIPPLRTSLARRQRRRRFAWMALATAAGIVLMGAASWFVARGNIDLALLLARGGSS